MRKIVLAGGRGQIGRFLTSYFEEQGDDVVVLSRRPNTYQPRTVLWDGRTMGNWATELDGADVLINLAGKTVNCRYNLANREAILNSRIDSTTILGKAAAQCDRPPKLWLQSSTATIYAHRYDGPNDEQNGILGGNEPYAPDTWQFSISVAKAWEQAFEQCHVPQTRKLLLRSAMVMDPNDKGVFDVLSWLTKKGLGNRMGDGLQYVSWIHYRDFCRALEWLIGHKEMDGVVNLAAPNPLPNWLFMQTLQRVWGVRFGLPAARWMLEIGAFFMRTETELVLKSRRVVPQRLLDTGFVFEFEEWASAAANLATAQIQQAAAQLAPALNSS